MMKNPDFLQRKEAEISYEKKDGAGYLEQKDKFSTGKSFQHVDQMGEHDGRDLHASLGAPDGRVETTRDKHHLRVVLHEEKHTSIGATRRGIGNAPPPEMGKNFCGKVILFSRALTFPKLVKNPLFIQVASKIFAIFPPIIYMFRPNAKKINVGFLKFFENRLK